jgi:hypothetical protein
MFVFGIDVLIMAVLAMLLVIASYLVATLVPLGYEEGMTAITATAATAMLMVIGYVVMTKVLDALVMTL